MTFASDNEAAPRLSLGDIMSGQFTVANERQMFQVGLSPGVYFLDFDGASVGDEEFSYETYGYTVFDADGQEHSFVNQSQGYLLEVVEPGPWFVEFWTGSLDDPAQIGGDFRFFISERMPSTPQEPDLVWSVRSHRKLIDPERVALHFEDSAGLEPWTDGEKSAILRALEIYSGLIMVDFVVVDDPDQATWSLTVFEDSRGHAGKARLPAGFDVQGIEFDRNIYDWNRDGFGPGTASFGVILHELGHALGLAHTHEAKHGSQILSGVTAGSGSPGDFGLNSTLYSAMSYNGLYKDVLTPMAIDIAALQAMYGARERNAGDDVYTVGLQDGGNYSIWDTGGIDELRVADGFGDDVFIDLRAASLHYAPGGGGFLSGQFQSTFAVTIAAGVVIENGTGGAGNNVIQGNTHANLLSGLDGSDRLFGDRGKDRLLGGDGKDALFGGRHEDQLFGDRGRDVLKGDSGHDLLSGGDGNDNLNGGEGDDILAGGNGRDAFVFQGEFGDDRITDFTVLGARADRLDLRALADIADFADLLANHLAADDAGVMLGVGQNSIILEGIAAEDLSASLFLF